MRFFQICQGVVAYLLDCSGPETDWSRAWQMILDLRTYGYVRPQGIELVPERPYDRDSLHALICVEIDGANVPVAAGSAVMSGLEVTLPSQEYLGDGIDIDHAVELFGFVFDPRRAGRTLRRKRRHVGHALNTILGMLDAALYASGRNPAVYVASTTAEVADSYEKNCGIVFSPTGGPVFRHQVEDLGIDLTPRAARRADILAGLETKRDLLEAFMGGQSLWSEASVAAVA